MSRHTQLSRDRYVFEEGRVHFEIDLVVIDRESALHIWRQHRAAKPTESLSQAHIWRAIRN